jgi:hypothetical protein
MGFWFCIADFLVAKHPHEVARGGLGVIQQPLTNLKHGKASTVKYVFRIEDIDGVSIMLMTGRCLR